VSGSITRRGIRSRRVKFEAGDRDPNTGKRQTRYITVRGTKKDAQRELIRLLGEVENGTAVDPSRAMVTEYLRAWLEHGEGLSPKTLERYRQLAEQQIIPHLGAIPLQKLRPAQVQGWHGLLLKSGGKDRKPLSARTVGPRSPGSTWRFRASDASRNHQPKCSASGTSPQSRDHGGYNSECGSNFGGPDGVTGLSWPIRIAAATSDSCARDRDGHASR
jgi:hypothetical protein